MEDFSRYKIKDYKYWTIFIFENQEYLGRCVVWCNRKNALDLADATQEEQKELFIVLKDLREASKNAFQPDWFNYSFLGNGKRHLHGHFIPRYSSEKKFSGIVFKDKRWGSNYRTDPNFVTPDDILEKIRLKLKKELKAL